LISIPHGRPRPGDLELAFGPHDRAARLGHGEAIDNGGVLLELKALTAGRIDLKHLLAAFAP